MAFIIKPLVTEKMSTIMDKQNKYGFIVRPDANKLQIKAEVEALYGVNVVAVNTAKYAGKNKSRPPQGSHQRFQEGCGDHQGRRNNRFL